MMWPLKSELSACTYTWYYLFLKRLENESWKFGRNLPLATFGSERVKDIEKQAVKNFRNEPVFADYDVTIH